MKVRIKTAHGYLSFQPDGRLEYRNGVGPWEEIDLEGFAVEAVPAQPTPVDEPPPPAADPWPHPSSSGGYVSAIKERLRRDGVDLTGPCGAFAITKRVAWGLRATGAGLLSKPYGNHCDGYATDIIAYPDGAIVDILGDGGNANVPQWQHGEDVEATRWREPVQP